MVVTRWQLAAVVEISKDYADRGKGHKLSIDEGAHDGMLSLTVKQSNALEEWYLINEGGDSIRMYRKPETKASLFER